MMGDDEDELKEKIRQIEEDSLIQRKKIDTRDFMKKREVVINEDKKEEYI